MNLSAAPADPLTPPPNVYRVSSAPMIHAPGTWRWFEAARNEPKKWKVNFLKAYFNDRASPEDIDMILNGRYITHEEPGEHGPTLVIAIQRKCR